MDKNVVGKKNSPPAHTDNTRNKHDIVYSYWLLEFRSELCKNKKGVPAFHIHREVADIL